jgi:MFS family permease
MSSETAGIYLMIIYVISIIFPPIMGIFTDKYGRKPSLLLIVNICFIACIIILIFLPSDCNHLIIIIPMILHGIFLSCFFPIVWTCIPMIVKLNSLGTAYGVLSSFVNSNQAVSPIIFGVIEDKTKSNYFWALVFVAFQAVIALYATVGVWISDYKNGEVLEKAKK